MSEPASQKVPAEEFRQLVRDVCHRLGYTPRPAPRARHTDYYLAADGDDGTGLEFVLDYKDKRRLRVRGVYPVPPGGRREFPGVEEQKGPLTVALSVGAEGVARALWRRFLPAYRTAYEKGLRQMALWVRAEARAELVARGVAERLGVGVGTNALEVRGFVHGGDRAFVRGLVDHFGVRLELDRLSYEQAEAVARALGQCKEPPGA